MKSKIFTLFLFLNFSCLVGYSQLSSASKIDEVYGSISALMTEDQMLWLENCIDRVSVILMPVTVTENILPLSEVPLLLKYGGDFVTDVTYDESTFNPLKYQFNFNLKMDQYFRIGTTESVIKIAKKD